MAKVLISPSILSSDFSRLGEEVRAIDEAGADWIHIDVMDGCFVPNLTYGAKVIETVRRVTTLPLDVHLMVVEPEKYFDVFAEAGASLRSIRKRRRISTASCTGFASLAAGPEWR